MKAIKAKNDLERAKQFKSYLTGEIAFQKLYKKDHPVDVTEKCLFTPTIIYPKKGQRIYCLGDLHGDFEALLYALEEASLINKTGEWNGGNSIVIQLGDILDSTRPGYGQVPYPSEELILNYMKNLHLEALHSGGMVITTIGNHDFNRLLSLYNHRGEITTSREADYSLVDDSDLGTLVSSNFYSLGSFKPYSDYMSKFDATSFEHNQSLMRLSSPNSYKGLGRHRQLFASCASKLVLKVVFDEDSRHGFLATHGGFHDYYLSFLSSLFQQEFEDLNRLYNLDLPLGFESNGDLVLMTVNAIFSYFLRVYHRIKYDRENLFDIAMVRLVTALGNFSGWIPNHHWIQTVFKDVSYENMNVVWDALNTKNFLFYRPYSDKDACRHTKASLEMLNLDPNFSSVIVAHSGPETVGKNLECRGDVEPRILLGRCNLCEKDINQDLIIITDVSVSRAFGSDLVINPQILEVTYGDDASIKYYVIESRDYRFDLFLQPAVETLGLSSRENWHNRVTKRLLEIPKRDQIDINPI